MGAYDGDNDMCVAEEKIVFRARVSIEGRITDVLLTREEIIEDAKDADDKIIEVIFTGVARIGDEEISLEFAPFYYDIENGCIGPLLRLAIEIPNNDYIEKAVYELEIHQDRFHLLEPGVLKTAVNLPVPGGKKVPFEAKIFF